MITFVTPYWSGREMMRVHLQSFRSFFPEAPILISKRGGGREEMEDYRKAFGIRYWLEDCGYEDALLRLLSRCETEFVCIADHDTILLSSPAPLLEGLVQGAWDLVGIEEKIRDHASFRGSRLSAGYRGWLRLAPGYMDATFLMFNLRSFLSNWGWQGIRAQSPHLIERELHYGICERLTRHKYLLPFHTRRYGIGNVLKDGETAVLWHQWYGAYRERLAGAEVEGYPGGRELAVVIAAGERALLADYPSLDLSGLAPAWGPELDAHAERRAIDSMLPPPPSGLERTLERLRRWRGYSLRKFLLHAIRWLERQWRLR